MLSANTHDTSSGSDKEESLQQQQQNSIVSMTSTIHPSFPKRRACANCRKAHALCDRERPCGRCIHHKITEGCVEMESRKRGRKVPVNESTSSTSATTKKRRHLIIPPLAQQNNALITSPTSASTPLMHSFPIAGSNNTTPPLSGSSNYSISPATSSSPYSNFAPQQQQRPLSQTPFPQQQVKLKLEIDSVLDELRRNSVPSASTSTVPSLPSTNSEVMQVSSTNNTSTNFQNASALENTLDALLIRDAQMCMQVENQPFPFLITNPSLQLIHWNKLFWSQLGYQNTDTLQHRNLEHFLSQQSARDISLHVMHMVQTKVLYSTIPEVNLVQSNGTLIKALTECNLCAFPMVPNQSSTTNPSQQQQQQQQQPQENLGLHLVFVFLRFHFF